MTTKVTDDALLENLRNLADELGRTPTATDVDKRGNHSSRTYRQYFPTFTTAVVRAGLVPKDWEPLTPEEIHKFNATAHDRPPEETLTALFFQFCPVPQEVYTEFRRDWLTTLADETILQIPAEYSPHTTDWQLRVPDTWNNPHTGDEEKTQLPDLLNWHLHSHDSTPVDTKRTIYNTLLRIASTSESLTTRQPVDSSLYGTVPRIKTPDLRHTHGIHLARNGASREWIARRMGLDRPEKAEVYFALLEHHDRY